MNDHYFKPLKTQHYIKITAAILQTNSGVSLSLGCTLLKQHFGLWASQTGFILGLI